MQAGIFLQSCKNSLNSVHVVGNTDLLKVGITMLVFDRKDIRMVYPAHNDLIFCAPTYKTAVCCMLTRFCWYVSCVYIIL